jgi:predicted RNase H-like HicB family nuclease
MSNFHYSMIIQWSDEDNKFIVTIPEFVGAVTHGNTYEEAVKNGKEVIELCIETEQSLGHPLPPPRLYYSMLDDDDTL